MTGRWVVRRWSAMGSTAELVLFADEPDHLADWVVGEVARLERCWSRFDPSSELVALNAAGGRPTVVSPTLLVALLAAREASALTAGRFDPAVLASLEAAGYDRTFNEVAPSAREAATCIPSEGYDAVDIDRATHQVVAPVRIDLGGIGKGLAVDLVVADLVARGVGSVALSLGGDIRVAGPGGGDAGSWSVPVQRPSDGRLLAHFPLVDEALVQSTTLLRSWERGGRRLHHIIDPSTGAPTDTGVDAAIVTGPRAAIAEAVAKAALVAGADAGIALIEASGLDGWLVLDDESVVATRDVAADLGVASGSAA